jgi:hypothetical protein
MNVNANWMAEDEINLLLAVQSMPPGGFVRDVLVRLQIPRNRARYLLDKWTAKGWYEYGVSLDLGWLTPSGRSVVPPQPMCDWCGKVPVASTGEECENRKRLARER